MGMTHSKLFHDEDYVTLATAYSFSKISVSNQLKAVLRTNYLQRYLNPDDNVAWQAVYQEFCTPRAGNPLIPEGVAALVLAHSIKCPPAVRYFQTSLRHLAEKQGLTASTLVDTYYSTLLWADGKILTEMHAIMSVTGRSHAVTGLAVNAGQLGLTTLVVKDGEESTM